MRDLEYAFIGIYLIFQSPLIFKPVIQQHYESKKQEILDEIQMCILSGINKRHCIYRSSYSV